MTTPPSEPYISEEDAERRSNREAFLILGGAFLFICVPPILCYSQYFQVAFWILMMVLAMLSGLTTLIIILRTADVLTWMGLRKRKRFIPGDEDTTSHEQR